MKEENSLDTATYNISRLVIAIPLLLLIVGISVKFMNFSSPTPTTQVAQLPTPSPQQNEFVDNVIQKSSAEEIKIDLQGPWFCSIETPNQINVWIQNKNVKAEFKEANQINTALVNGDCLYRWNSAEKGGKKMCGLSQYFPLFQILSQLKVVNTDTFATIIPALSISGMNINTNVANTLMKSCKRQEIPNSVFTIPNRSFTDMVAITPGPSLKP